MKGFNNWINTHSDDVAENELKSIWEATSSYKKGYVPNLEERHDEFMQHIGAENNIANRVVSIKRNARLWRVAAAVAFLIVAGFAVDRFLNDSSMVHFASDSSTEILELEDGTAITLNSASQLDFPAHLRITFAPSN